MPPVRMTHNAVTSYQRGLRPSASVSSAYRELREMAADAHFTAHAPHWLGRVRGDTDGYLLLDDDTAALPVRRGRVVACLVNPTHTRR
jgi:hypothetical protein